jgi:D-tagatose-1,6-bisphosphate aldolase subunit GatZ/KbaZ
VEFGDNFVVDYDPLIARGLSQFVEQEPRLVYEAHSTDYQQRSSLRDLVRDHFAILKVGPALTFAFREMVFALAMMEEEMLAGRPEAERSHLVDVIDEAMRRQPAHWQGYYRGSPGAQAFARKFSLSDRIRYYWPQADVRAALECLMRNLGSIPPPLALLSQHAPRQFARIREGVLENTPRALILDHIGLVLDDYDAACLPGGSQAFES